TQAVIGIPGIERFGCIGGYEQDAWHGLSTSLGKGIVYRQKASSLSGFYENTPHPPSYLGYPLPKGEGKNLETSSLSQGVPRGEGGPAARDQVRGLFRAG